MYPTSKREHNSVVTQLVCGLCKNVIRDYKGDENTESAYFCSNGCRMDGLFPSERDHGTVIKRQFDRQVIESGFTEEEWTG